MLRRNLILFSLIALTSLVVLYSCQDTLIEPKPCTEEPDLPINKIFLTFIVDSITVVDSIFIDKKGFVTGDSIVIRSKNFKRTATLGGHICEETKFSVEVKYTDTVDNSRLRIDGAWTGNIMNVSLFYCDNINNNCNFTKIGYAYGSFTDYKGFVTVFSPKFFGEVDYFGTR